MDLLLRELTRQENGHSEYHDTEVSSSDVTLGCGSDQTIQLLGPGVQPHHATLSKSGNRIQLNCHRGCRIRHQEKSVTSIQLVEGDVLEVGNNRIRVISAPPGFDLGLEVERALDIDSRDFEASYRTQLDQTWLSKRASSWIGLLLVLVLFLGLPLFGFYRMEKPDGSVGKLSPLLPSDKLWSSGPLIPAHRVAIGDDCVTCHVNLFEKVKDERCLVCHDRIPDHVATSHLSKQVGLDSRRCASCHREHNEPSHITVDANSLCTDCHSKSQQTSIVGVELGAVSGFDAQSHPEFKVQLLMPEGSERGTGAIFNWKPVRVTLPQAKEQSNLKFPHKVHLNQAKVRNASTDAALECSDCHKLSADDEHFTRISMESECQACHELTFDPSDPQRQLPHGAPSEAVLAMEGHYLLKYADPDAHSKNSTRRRLPGRTRDEEVCKGSAFVCAQEKTALEVSNQFTRRGCITCHEVSSNAAVELYSRYQVLPVRLAEDYYPWAKFDHRSHLTQEDKVGSTACLSCHKARESEESSDVLIPDMANCVVCHGDGSSNRNLILHCIECHSFHLEDVLQKAEER